MLLRILCWRQAKWGVSFLACIAIFSGCATTPVSYQTHPRMADALGTGKRVAVVPIDIEVSEAKAGNRLEKRDEWTATAHGHLREALRKKFHLSEAELPLQDDPSLKAEIDDLKSMTALFTVVKGGVLLSGQPDIPGEAQKALDFNMGNIDKLAGHAKADVVVLVYVRDAYSSAGRKALGAVAMIAGAAVGVVIVPGSAPTLCSAVAVDRDGTVLWINSSGSVGDLRTSEGAEALVNELFKGLPSPLLPAS